MKLKYVTCLAAILSLAGGATMTVQAQTASNVSNAQNSGYCTGVVLDDTGTPIIGATVMVKGTTNRASTNLDGEFSLVNVKKGSTIAFSFIGCAPYETVWNGEPLSVTLQSTAQELVDDFEILEHGTARKFDWNNPADATDPYANRDPRFYASILYDGAKWKDRELETWLSADGNSGRRDSKYGQDAWNTSQTGYNMKKFMDENYVGNSWQFSAKNYIWLRMGELYLDQAEANAMAGHEDVAKGALNKVRARAGMPDVNKSGSELVEAIRHERRIELCFEKNRYFDVRRWKLGPQYLAGKIHRINITKNADGTKTYKVGEIPGDFGTRIFDEKIYWVPILKSEIDKNPNIVQNPGYDK